MSKRGFSSVSRFWVFGAWILVLGCGSSETLEIEYQIASGSAEPDLIVKISMNADGTTKEDVIVGEGLKFGGSPNAILGCAKALGIINSTNANNVAVDSGGIDGSTCIAQLGAHLNTLGVTEGLNPPHTSGRMSLLSDNASYVFVLTFFNLGTGTKCVHLAGAEIRARKFFINSSGQATTTLTFTASSTGISGAVTSGDVEKCFLY